MPLPLWWLVNGLPLCLSVEGISSYASNQRTPWNFTKVAEGSELSVCLPPSGIYFAFCSLGPTNNNQCKGPMWYFIKYNKDIPLSLLYKCKLLLILPSDWDGKQCTCQVNSYMSGARVMTRSSKYIVSKIIAATTITIWLGVQQYVTFGLLIWSSRNILGSYSRNHYSCLSPGFYGSAHFHNPSRSIAYHLSWVYCVGRVPETPDQGCLFTLLIVSFHTQKVLI